MLTRERVLHHLKRNGAATVAEVAAALSLSANAARHHLGRLAREGAVMSEPDRSGTAGRPAVRYGLTVAAEAAFPKRYLELLAAVLAQAERDALLGRLLAGVVEAWAAPQRDALARLAPRVRLRTLLEGLDYGDMLPALTEREDGWQLVAYNCLYRDAGCQVEGVCDLLPRVVASATGLGAERQGCQRDGHVACIFTGDWCTRA